MNDLSNEALRDSHCCSFKPLPKFSLHILVTLFFLGLTVSLFILIVVRNAFFFISLLLLTTLVIAFIFWNTHSWNNKATIFFFLRSFPHSDLRLAKEGQLVKITGIATCGSVSLESSYERATRCIYASTTLYEYRGFSLKSVTKGKASFKWNLAHCERLSTDFSLVDQDSGIRVVVNAGSDCKVIPLIKESKIINTTSDSRILSPHLRKWLRERNLSAEGRLLRLEEGYVQEGSFVTVFGMLQRSDDVLMIIQPPKAISTGCLWQRFLLPVDIDGLVIGVSHMSVPMTNHDSAQNMQS